MTAIVWDKSGDRVYETGVDHGVLYPMNALGTYPTAFAWNGLVSVTEKPSGAEPTPVYADNIKYLNLVSAEQFSATIEAYTYPDAFAACDGSAEAVVGVKLGQQPRKQFGLCYRTVVGNDVSGEAYGYKLHIIYGCTASPSEKAYQSINESPEAITFSWEISTVPPVVSGFKPTAYIVIDSTKADPTKLADLEAILFGTAEFTAMLPLPDAVISNMTP